MLSWRTRLQIVVVLVGLIAAGWIVLAVHGGRARPEPLKTHPGIAAMAGEAASSGDLALVIPVRGVRPGQLVDTFTQARENGARPHDAIDIMAPRGTPVIAAAGGMVEKLFISQRGGQTIYLRSPDRRTVYYYAHLNSYAPGIAERQRLAQGQVIGTVGTTGNADPLAPHLHFAIFRTTPEAAWFRQAPAINPYPLLVRR
jgi:peptidoglycan LD-endopeptidase LytH